MGKRAESAVRESVAEVGIATLEQPLMRGLACAALHSGLRSVLVFDASPTTLETMAGLLAQMVVAVEDISPKPRVAIAQLGAVETEEELWGSLTLGQEKTAQTLVWQPGLLSAGQGNEIRIVVIPDVSRLSLAASRACVMVMGADVTHLERHGQGDRWRPQVYWLAGCDPNRVGTLSPHLLDRFAVRLSGGEAQDSARRLARLRSWMDGVSCDPEPRILQESGVLERLQKAQQCSPEILPEARERVLEYVELTEGYSPRRDLAVLRLARVNAQLENLEQVTARMVDRAAEMMGLSLKSERIEEGRSPNDIPLPEVKEPPQPASQDIPSSTISKQDRNPAQTPTESVYQSDTEKTLPSTPLPVGGATVDPYLEDRVESQREATSLRLPPRRFKTATAGRGEIIGVEPTTVPQDLAVVSTLLEAAKYQALRWKALLEKSDRSSWEEALVSKWDGNGHQPLILQAGDLRRYRRAAVAEQLLTLVLDYTSVKDCRWQEALLPYLQWAYVERARVCLVQVGAVDARDELRAERREADSILVPRVRQRLEAERGRATPLAHGLDLALQTLRHSLQHGRSGVQQAVLVVISDGRGNVPLAASRVGKVEPPVGRKGVEDALEVARQIAALKGVEAVVLNPQPKHYTELPVMLAQALGAKIAKIPSAYAWEVDE